MASNFKPTDEDLMEALAYKVFGVSLPSHEYIRSADLYGESEPWEIFGDAGESSSLYFFTKRKKFGVLTTDPPRFSRKVGRGKWAEMAHKRSTGMGNDFIGYKKNFKYVPPKKGSGDDDGGGGDRRYSWHMDEYSFRKDWPVTDEYKDYAICVLS